MNSTDKFGKTALHYAVCPQYTNNKLKSNSLPFIKALLERPDCDINIRDFHHAQNPFLTMLTCHERDDLIRLFLKRTDLDILSRNNINLDAFYYKPSLQSFLEDSLPCKYCNNASWELEGIIKQIDYDANMYDTAFFRTNIQIYLDYNANPNYMMDDLYSPLVWVCTTKNRPYGYDDSEIEANLSLRTYVLKILLNNKNTDINLSDTEGNTPLHLAARDNNWQLVEVLLKDKNINCNKTDKDGNTPLMALLHALHYKSPDKGMINCLKYFITNNNQTNFKVVNFQNHTIDDIIKKRFLPENWTFTAQ